MSFTASSFTKKLESLQDTQESIVSISQWVLFHHKHSKAIADLWSSFILNKHQTSSKKLSLLYLCNDVVQQAKHKKRYEFLKSFALMLPDVLAKVYPSLDPAIKPKVERLIKVWTDRSVFNPEDLQNMKSAIESAPAAAPSDSSSSGTNSPSGTNDPPPGESIVPELRHLSNLFNHMNQLVEISQANLNQVGIQSKTFLPNDPSVSDNLPAPKVYISKLNNLEKLCQVSNQNIDEIKKDRVNILNALSSLKKVIEEGLKTDESKKTIIHSKLSSLHKTRNELIEMVNDEEGESNIPVTFNTNDDDDGYSASAADYEEDDEDDDDDVLPTYDNDESDGESKTLTPPTPKPEMSLPQAKRAKKSKAKSVAFAENIEVKEYDRDTQTEIIKIIKSDDDQTEVDEDGEESESALSDDFQRHHKDVVELNHEKSDDKPSVLDILSKLQ